MARNRPRNQDSSSQAAVFSLLPGPSPNVSNGRSLIQQPDRTFNGRWAQMHVPLSCGQVAMPSKFLNGPCGAAPHGQV
jgi:hypothetical protein